MGDIMEIKEMEQLIKQVKSVLSCKIVIDSDSNVEELHILSDMKRSPKQISRDIQSLLISRFGLEIDYKKISIAQIDEETLEDKAFRLKVKTIEFTTSGTKANVKVTLAKDEDVFQGEITGVNTLSNSNRMLATATLKAVEGFLGLEDNFILEDIKAITLAGREAVVTAITFIAEDNEQLFSGCAFINRDKKEAIVKSTLDAINRRVIKHLSES